MSDGKRLLTAGLAFVVLQVGVLLMVLFFLDVQPERLPGPLLWLSLISGLLLWAVAFFLLARALKSARPRSSPP